MTVLRHLPPASRILAALAVACAMVLSAVSGCASETNSGNTPAAGLSGIQAGDIIELGAFEQDGNTANGPEPIEWRVLSVSDGSALLISVYGLEGRVFDADIIRTDGWDDSDLKEWLAGDFAAQAFSDEERAIIEGDPFCLSAEEAREHFASDEDRRCRPTPVAARQIAYQYDGCCWWWLSTAADDVDGMKTALIVGDRGNIVGVGVLVDSECVAVRPAIRVRVE